MGVFDRQFREIFFSQLVSILGGLIAGTILAASTDKLLLLPGMFILLPGFLELRGNISGSMAARLTSGLFLGVIHPTQKRSKVVKGNTLASFILVIIISFVLGLLAFAFSYLAFGIFVPKILLIAVFAGILANLLEIPLTLFLTFYFFKKGHDPNNIMGPFVTSTGDITSIISLLVVMFLI